MIRQTIKKSWIEWILLLILVFLTPLFIFPSVKYLWVLLILPVILFIRFRIRKRFLPKTALDLPLLLLTIQVIATCIIVPDLSFSLPKITGVFFGILIFYAVTSVLIEEEFIKGGISLYILGGMLFALLTLSGLNWDYDSLVFSLARLLGIPLDKTVFTRQVIPSLEKVIPRLNWNIPGSEHGFNGNAIGGFIILLFPLCLAILIPYCRSKSAANRLYSKGYFAFFLILFMVIFSGILFLTLSIVSWMALVISLWIVFFSKKWKAVSAGLLVALVIFSILIFPSKFSSISKTIKGDLDPEKIDYRLQWWGIAVDTIKSNPFFGIGMNRIRLHPEIGYERSHVHNHFLQTAAELGIPGLLAYLAIVAVAAIMCVRIWHNPAAGWMKYAAMGLGCGQLAHFLFGTIDCIPLGAKVGIFFWLSLSMITALYNYSIRRTA